MLNNTSLKKLYITFRNKLTKLVKKAKTSYYPKEILKGENNNKRCWELINKASNRTN